MMASEKKGTREIGKYRYPLTITPASALEIASKVLNVYKTDCVPTIALAKISGHKVNEQKGLVPGAFHRKLEAMYLSGVFKEEKRGTQKITDLARKALDPTDPEGSKKASPAMGDRRKAEMTSMLRKAAEHKNGNQLKV